MNRKVQVILAVFLCAGMALMAQATPPEPSALSAASQAVQHAKVWTQPISVPSKPVSSAQLAPSVKRLKTLSQPVVDLHLKLTHLLH